VKNAVQDGRRGSVKEEEKRSTFVIGSSKSILAKKGKGSTQNGGQMVGGEVGKAGATEKG